MATLSFIGLAPYTDNVSNTFVNIIFIDSSSTNNTYEYGFSTTNSTIPTFNPLPNVHNITPTSDIFAQIPCDVNNTCIWLRISGDTNQANYIWQSYIFTDITPNTIATFTSFNTLPTFKTIWGTGPSTTGTPIANNYFYTSSALTINLTNPSTN